MFFRMPRFIRRFIRNRMHPMHEEKAWDLKTKLSIFYAFLAWNAGGYVLYQVAKGNKSWPKTAGVRSDDDDIVRPAIAWAHSLGIPKADVIKISNRGGISKTQSFEVDIEDAIDKITLPTKETESLKSEELSYR